MCPPTFFGVTYAINPWMRPDEPTDAGLAMRQWQRLHDAYLRLGHDVRVIEPVPGLPDMVFAANGATVIGGTVLGVRFRHPQRAAEATAYLDWFRAAGWPSVVVPRYVNEGQGDFLAAGQTVLAGYGFRSEKAAADDLTAAFGLPVVSLRLVDPRFYHLDTALCVLDDTTAMYYPAAFDDAGREALASVFSELIEAKDGDAEVLGLNAVSDGRHVLLAAEATGLARQLAQYGFEPVPVEVSELRKAGGSAKCCTLELLRWSPGGPSSSVVTSEL
jgi:N-dimethylarginine dimethylaminohydrolase